MDFIIIYKIILLLIAIGCQFSNTWCFDLSYVYISIMANSLSELQGTKDILSLALESVHKCTACWLTQAVCYSWSHSTNVCISRLSWPSIMTHLTVSCLPCNYLHFIYFTANLLSANNFKFNNYILTFHDINL